MELSKLMSDFSSVLTTLIAQHEVLLIFGSFVALPFAIVYLGPRLADNILNFLQPYSKRGLKNNTLNINAGAKKGFMDKIAAGAAVLSVVLFWGLPSSTTFFLFYLVCIVGYIYASLDLDLAPGIYKNGKYLGTVSTAFIKAGNGLTLGKRQGTETIGALKILRNGWIVAELNLTAEGFMELSPDKISEVFSEIKGNIEKFKDLYKVGDYTLQYSFFTKSHVYENKGGYDSSSRKDSLTTDPIYSYLPGNIWHSHYDHRH